MKYKLNSYSFIPLNDNIKKIILYGNDDLNSEWNEIKIHEFTEDNKIEINKSYQYDITENNFYNYFQLKSFNFDDEDCTSDLSDIHYIGLSEEDIENNELILNTYYKEPYNIIPVVNSNNTENLGIAYGTEEKYPDDFDEHSEYYNTFIETYSTTQIIPKLTSNTSNGTASASSVYSTTYPAYKAFNQTRSSNTDCWYPKSPYVPSWVQYQFPNNNKYTICRFYISSRYGANFIMNNAYIAGSNDGTNFEIIKEFNFPDSTSIDITLSDISKPYNIFRIYYKDRRSTGDWGMSQIYLYGKQYSEDDEDYKEYYDLVYSNQFQVNQESKYFQVFDNNDKTHWISNNVAVGDYLGFKFTNNKKYRLYSYNFKSLNTNYSYPTSFKLQARNNDSEEYITLDEKTNIELDVNKSTQNFLIDKSKINLLNLTNKPYSDFRLLVTDSSNDTLHYSITNLKLLGLEESEYEKYKSKFLDKNDITVEIKSKLKYKLIKYDMGESTCKNYILEGYNEEDDIYEVIDDQRESKLEDFSNIIFDENIKYYNKFRFRLFTNNTYLKNVQFYGYSETDQIKSDHNLYNLNIVDSKISNIIVGNINSLKLKYTISPTNNINPKLTSDTSSGTASASSVYSSTYPAWKAFNRTNDSETDCWYPVSGYTSPQWLQYKFASGKYCIYRVRLQGRAPASTYTDGIGWSVFDLLGSNNGTTFELIETFNVPEKRTDLVSFKLSSLISKPYQYFRLQLRYFGSNPQPGISRFYLDGWAYDDVLKILQDNGYSDDSEIMVNNQIAFNTLISNNMPYNSTDYYIKIKN